MRIPPYWVRESYTGHDTNGQPQTFVAWGWSFQSREEAQDDGRARARRIFDYMIQGRKPERYPYLDRPMREEIVQTVPLRGKDIAVLTRNKYGALVLNSANVLFADIDFPAGKPGGGGLMKRLFGGGGNQPSGEALTLGGIQNWAAHNPGRTFRLYRTKAGLRLLFTDKLYEPKSSETAALLASVGSDPMYQLLTQKQESFRARLTPKPWRCDFYNPPNQYPWSDSQSEAAFRAWEREYKQSCAGYKTCELVEEVGLPSGLEEIGMITELHDKIACPGDGQMLA